MADTAERVTPRELDRVIIRFAGDSGDGMQLTGDRFTSASAVFGNDLATLPEFPAEIRAYGRGPQAGVSAFQVHISDHDITTPGDAPSVLVAMNPAALHAEPREARAGRHPAHQHRLLRRAETWPRPGSTRNPLDRLSLKGYNVYEVPMTSLTKEACAPLGVKPPRCRPVEEPVRAFGLISWMYTRPEQAHHRLGHREVRPSGPRSATPTWPPSGPGHAFGETAELFDHPYQVLPAPQSPGTYTNITGNTAAWLGAWWPPANSPSCRSSSAPTRSPRPRTSSTRLSKHKNFGVRTVQAEDEIAGIGAAPWGPPTAATWA